MSKSKLTDDELKAKAEWEKKLNDWKDQPHGYEKKGKDRFFIKHRLLQSIQVKGDTIEEVLVPTHVPTKHSLDAAKTGVSEDEAGLMVLASILDCDRAELGEMHQADILAITQLLPLGATLKKTT